MARKDRTGARKTREQRTTRRIPEMGYYLVVTDTEATERCYFTGLHQSLPKEIQNKLVIKVVETRTQDMIQKCLEMTAYDAQYRIPWIVFDRDEVQDFDRIIQGAQNAGIQVGWSNPCFEIWMFAYFGSMPAIYESWTCCNRFEDIFQKQTGHPYSKADEDLYRHLIENGNEMEALKIAVRKQEQCLREGKLVPSEMCPCTTVHELVGEIRGKVDNSTQ